MTNIEIPSLSSWWGSGLPQPKVMLNRAISPSITDDLWSTTFSLVNPIVVQTQDLTQEQLSRWVKVEFLYYRRGKKKTTHNRAYKAWFVHPSHMDQISWMPAHLHDPFRAWDHNWPAIYRPSEFPVSSNWEIIPLREALNWRFKVGNVLYRDTTWTEQTILVPAPIRRFSALNSINITNKYYYSPIYSPLYVRARYAIKNTDWTWESWPVSDVFTVTNTVHPFLYNPVQSWILWTQCCDISPAYTATELQCYAWPWRLP